MKVKKPHSVPLRKALLLIAGILLDLEYLVMLSWPFFAHLAQGQPVTTSDYVRFGMAVQGTLTFAVWSKYSAWYLHQHPGTRGTRKTPPKKNSNIGGSGHYIRVDSTNNSTKLKTPLKSPHKRRFCGTRGSGGTAPRRRPPSVPGPNAPKLK